MKKLRGIDFGGYGVFMRKKGVNNFHKKGRKGAEGLVWKGVKMLFGASPIQSLLKKENQQQIVDKASEVFPAVCNTRSTFKSANWPHQEKCDEKQRVIVVGQGNADRGHERIPFPRS